MAAATTIGFLAYGPPPRDIMPPGRVRALLAEAALQDAALQLLSIDHLDPAGNSVQAEVWTRHGFIRREVDLPDVVVALNWPRRPAHQQKLDWLTERVPVIDDSGPDKLLLAELLWRTPLAPYVIPCEELSEPTAREALEAWLVRHGASVVKAANGMRGGGLFFLEPAAPGQWLVRKDDTTLRTDLHGAVDYVIRRIAGRLSYRRYLVQRYVPSRAADGRAADFRVHLQRDGSGGWSQTRTYVRLAELGLPMSNVSRGGYQGQPASFLAQRRIRQPDAIAAELGSLALDVTLTLERLRGQELSELGVDIAIDEQDRLWLIETNTHPQTSLHEHERAVNTIAYALHVAARHMERAGRAACATIIA